MDFREINENQAILLQQIVSLRNECVHNVLPKIPEGIQNHLFFFGCKFFKDLSIKHFPKTKKILERNYLTISFDQVTTYADQLQKMVGNLRRGKSSDKELVWILERGARFIDDQTYISQPDFEKLYRQKKKIIPHLKVGKYIEDADMVCIVPVQAPKNFTADIILRKGSKEQKGSLPVTIKKTKIEDDYQFLTRDIAEKIGKSTNFVAKSMSDLGLKGNDKYHQSIRTSRSGEVQRYSQAALSFLEKYLAKNQNYNPYRANEN